MVGIFIIRDLSWIILCHGGFAVNCYFDRFTINCILTSAGTVYLQETWPGGKSVNTCIALNKALFFSQKLFLHEKDIQSTLFILALNTTTKFVIMII